MPRIVIIAFLGFVILVGARVYLSVREVEPIEEAHHEKQVIPVVSEAEKIPVISQPQTAPAKKENVIALNPTPKTTMAASKEEPAVSKEAAKLDPRSEKLFSGDVPGFPKLDAQTRETLERIDLMAREKPREALNELQRAHEADPNNELITVRLAMMKSGLDPGKPETAAEVEALLRDNVAKHPDSRAAKAALGDYYAAKGRYGEAADLQKDALGDEPEGYRSLGRTYARGGKFEQAVQSLTQSFQMSQEDIHARQARGEDTSLAEMELARVAVERGFALTHVGNAAEAQKMAQFAQTKLGPDDLGVKKLREALNGGGPAPIKTAE